MDFNFVFNHRYTKPALGATVKEIHRNLVKAGKEISYGTLKKFWPAWLSLSEIRHFACPIHVEYHNRPKDKEYAKQDVYDHHVKVMLAQQKLFAQLRLQAYEQHSTVVLWADFSPLTILRSKIIHV
jgi:hypothetical protein